MNQKQRLCPVPVFIHSAQNIVCLQWLDLCILYTHTDNTQTRILLGSIFENPISFHTSFTGSPREHFNNFSILFLERQHLFLNAFFHYSKQIILWITHLSHIFRVFTQSHLQLIHVHTATTHLEVIFNYKFILVWIYSHYVSFYNWHL